MKLALKILTVTIVVGWFLFLRPSFMGGPASYILVNGISMEPTMHTGDFALAIKQDSYKVGDVVPFKVEAGENQGYRVPDAGGIVIHRIIGGNGVDGYQLQGDNNSWVDPWQPTHDEVLGRTVFFVPRLGFLFSYLQDPFKLSLVVGGIFAYTSMAGLVMAKRMGKSRQRRRDRLARRNSGGVASWLPL